MTYTFKLARRLAILRHFVVITILALVVACGKDFTAPEPASTGSLDDSPSLQVTPRAITIETDQRVQFRGRPVSVRDGAFLPSVRWTSSGGTIDTTGYFSSSTTGTFKVVGRGRGWKQADTSVVIVVPRPSPDMVRIEVSPTTATLDTGATKTFVATGYMSDSTTAPVGVVWSATGGEVDPSGVYSAGPSGGKYHVIATTTAGTFADTAVVVINVPSAPLPTLTDIIVSPASASLTAGASAQFKAFGRNSNGDSVAVSVAFSASGGSITAGGLYTAGTVGGTYKVIAMASGLADTSVATVSASAPISGQVGIPFGASQQYARAGGIVVPFTLTKDATVPSDLLTRIADARAKGYKLLPTLADGSHSAKEDGSGPLLSIIDGVLQYDSLKFQRKIDQYNTSTIKQAVASAVADGIIIGSMVMDEPYVHSLTGNTWGPAGTMTKARVDNMCAYVKKILPTLPVGPEAQHHLFEPTKSYRVCDFFIDQYKAAYGEVTTYRDAALAQAQRDGMKVLFGLNVLDGGVPDKDGTWDCTSAGQAGKGTYSPVCRMTSTQVRDWGLILGPAGCGLYFWRYDSDFVNKSENQQAFRDVGAGLSKAAWRSCGRP